MKPFIVQIGEWEADDDNERASFTQTRPEEYTVIQIDVANDYVMSIGPKGELEPWDIDAVKFVRWLE